MKLNQPEKETNSDKPQPVIREVGKSAVMRFITVYLMITPICAIIILIPICALMAFPAPLMALFFGFIMVGTLFRGTYLLLKRLFRFEYKEATKIYLDFTFQFSTMLCLYTFSRAFGDLFVWISSGEYFMGFPIDKSFVYPYLFFGPFCILAAGSYTLLDFIWRSRQIRQLDNIPTSKIRSAAIGLVELRGRAAHYRDTDSACVISSEGLHPFYLEDETGRVLIDPKGCRIRDDWYWFNAISNTIFEMGGMLGLREIVLRNRAIEIGVENYHYIVQPGDPLYVIGSLEINDNPAVEDDERLVVRARKRPGFGEAFLDVFSGGLDYRNIFFISDSGEKSARKLMQQGRKVSLIIGISFTIGGLFVLWEGIWGLGVTG
ncbi:MAG: E3 ubiquitin ligase family protein [Desulfobulbaceae bacterium]|nr:E3 ubiquitin ligase family protein [Desulfobulbaceae bacterium]